MSGLVVLGWRAGGNVCAAVKPVAGWWQCVYCCQACGGLVAMCVLLSSLWRAL